MDMTASDRSATGSLLAEGEGDLVSEGCVFGAEPFDLGSGRVESLAWRLLGAALRDRDPNLRAHRRIVQSFGVMLASV